MRMAVASMPLVTGHGRTPSKGIASRRRGSLVVELILVFPILFVLLMGTIEFSLLLSARQQLLTASREGARVAAQGAGNEEVIETVERMLSASSCRDADVKIERMPDNPDHPHRGRDRVRVCVSVSAGDTVPNVLPWIINLRGQDLTACTVMNTEYALRSGRESDGEEHSKDHEKEHKSDGEKDHKSDGENDH